MKQIGKSVLWAYIKCRFPYFLTVLIFVLTYLVVNVLYHLPLESVIYAIVLSGTLFLGMMFLDFLWYVRKHRKLKHIIKEKTVLPEILPKADDLIEEDYRTIIDKLYADNLELLTKFDAKQTQIIDYYTMWVHQIKGPISAMGLLLQTDHQEGNSEIIKQELFKIEQYVEMVIHYLRIENISSDLLLKEYNLYELVKQAVRKYSVLFIYKKISLCLEEFECTILTDEKWLVFVLEQIISNAVKYTKKGSVSIYLDSKRPKTLVIEDTGIGIGQEDIPQIFNRGFTGYNGRMDKKSTGIGLYLTKKILTKLSNTIDVTSIVGQGTKVFIGLDSSKIEIE